MSRIRSLTARAARAAIRCGMPPRWAGYRLLRPVSARDAVDRALRRGDRRAEFETIEPESRAEAPLPVNVSSRDALPRARGVWGFSCHDVPDRLMRPTVRATVPDVWIASVRDRFGDESYAAITRDLRALRIRGTVCLPSHAPRIRARASAPEMERAWWILEQWNCNYSHWLQWHLPKIEWIRDRGGAGGILLPRPNRIEPVVRASVRLLGVDPDTCPVFRDEIVRVGALSFLNIDDYRPTLLRAFRDRILPPGGTRAGPGRKVFISRSRALWRQIANEEDCWRILEPLGYERVCMEDLAFDEQVARMKETTVLLSLHGSGLGNMIFAPPGCQVVEVMDPAFPCPQFYALASALGHPYWLLEGRGVGEQKPCRDLEIPCGPLR
jgi:hypothetical protein